MAQEMAKIHTCYGTSFPPKVENIHKRVHFECGTHGCIPAVMINTLLIAFHIRQYIWVLKGMRE